jgi:hypoxanthine phosphoribosyltransferase
MSNLFIEASKVLNNAELVYDNKQVLDALDNLASNINLAINTDSPDDQAVIVLSVMNGGMVLTGHLLTRLKFPLHVDYVHATRYRDNTHGGELNWKVKSQNALAGRTLLVLDDILDEGYTLDAIIKYCENEGAKKIITAVLVDKKHDRRKPGVSCDYTGLEVDDKYVFGFGMDYKGYHRNLDGIYALSSDK